MYNSMYYNNFYPYQAMGAGTKGLLRGGLLGGLNKIKWGSLLTNTQKTLNVINQAIPVYYQVKPIYNNAKTMFRVMGAMKDSPQTSTANTNIEGKKNTNQNQPVFFL